MTSLMTSPGHKISQILKSIYLRQYWNYSVDQKLINVVNAHGYLSGIFNFRYNFR